MNNYLDLRDQATVRCNWKLSDTIRRKLDKFFLLHDTWSGLLPDFVYDEVEYKRYLIHENEKYEVVCLRDVQILQAAKELGLSFRVHRKTGIKHVLINVWHEEEKSQ